MSSDVCDLEKIIFQQRDYKQNPGNNIIVEIELAHEKYNNNNHKFVIIEKLLEARITCLQQVASRQPNFIQAYLNWSNNLSNTDKINKEFKSNAKLLKSLCLQQNLAEIYFYIGNKLAITNNLDEATICYFLAIKLEPQHGEAYFKLGEILANNNQTEAATDYFIKALEIKSDYAEAYFKLGEILANNNQTEAATDYFIKALEIKSDYAEAYFKLGEILANNNQTEAATDYFIKALEIKSDYAEAYFKLGEILAQLNQLHSSITCFQQTLKLEPDLIKTEYFLEFISKQENNQQNQAYDSLQEAFFYYTLQNSAIPPRNSYELTRDWAVASQKNINYYFEISPEHLINILPPLNISNNFNEYFQETLFTSPATFVVILLEGHACYLPDVTAIITPDNWLLADISPYAPTPKPRNFDKSYYRNHPILSLKNLPECVEIHGKVAVLPSLFANNYFHWMIDILPSINLLYQSQIDIDSIDNFVISGYSNLPFQLESLEILGIPSHKIISSEHLHVKAQELIVPSLPSYITFATKSTCDFLRSTFLKPTNLKLNNQQKRIYISRKKASFRRVINEDELLVILEKLDFKFIELESLSVVEQANIMQAAEVIVAPHGAGLTNLIFCSLGTKVIEIFASPTDLLDTYWLISNLIDIKYYILIGEAPQCSCLRKFLNPWSFTHPWSLTEDIFVNINSLLNLFQFADIS